MGLICMGPLNMQIFSFKDFILFIQRDRERAREEGGDGERESPAEHRAGHRA